MQATIYTWTINCQKQNAMLECYFCSEYMAAGTAMQKMCFPPNPKWMTVNIAMHKCFLTVNAWQVATTIVKVNLGPQANVFSGCNEKTHVETWVALQQSLCRRNTTASCVVEKIISLMKMTWKWFSMLFIETVSFVKLSVN